MTSFSSIFSLGLALLGGSGDGGTRLRMDLVEPTGRAGAETGGLVPVTINSPGGNVELGFDLVLISALEPCASDPSACDGSENFRREDPVEFITIFGCRDGVDNDEDGFSDAADPDCVGIQGWSLSVAAESCLGLRSVTTIGTVADGQNRPPGMRDIQSGSFEKSEVVNPTRNNGQQGAVSAVVLSFTNPVILPQLGEFVILKLRGALSSPPLPPGSGTEPCVLRVVRPDEQGLAGSGEPVQTAITVAGATVDPVAGGVAVRLQNGSRFSRGDCDGDGQKNLTDGLVLLNYLFLAGAVPSCLAACDFDASGRPNITSALYFFNYLFLEGPNLPAPFPGCGQGGARDLSCDATPRGCA
jgi:hypothetical protein